MSLTNRILLAMVAGIALGSLLEWLMGALDPGGGLHAFIENGLILGLFDVVGRVFIASLKLRSSLRITHPATRMPGRLHPSELTTRACAVATPAAFFG